MEAREGYTRAQKKRMILSDATILGLKMTGKQPCAAIYTM